MSKIVWFPDGYMKCLQVDKVGFPINDIGFPNMVSPQICVDLAVSIDEIISCAVV